MTLIIKFNAIELLNTMEISLSFTSVGILCKSLPEIPEPKIVINDKKLLTSENKPKNSMPNLLFILKYIRNKQADVINT